MSRELLQKSLDALKFAREFDEDHWSLYSDPIEEIEAELAKPELEPTAWLVKKGNVGRVVFNQDDLEYELKEGYSVSMKLYASPPERAPLTNDRIIEMYRQGGAIDANSVDFARAIEKEHGIGK
jgi:hypothetical protein